MKFNSASNGMLLLSAAKLCSAVWIRKNNKHETNIASVIEDLVNVRKYDDEYLGNPISEVYNFNFNEKWLLSQVPKDEIDSVKSEMYRLALEKAKILDEEEKILIGDDDVSVFYDKVLAFHYAGSGINVNSFEHLLKANIYDQILLIHEFKKISGTGSIFNREIRTILLDPGAAKVDLEAKQNDLIEQIKSIILNGADTDFNDLFDKNYDARHGFISDLSALKNAKVDEHLISDRIRNLMVSHAIIDEAISSKSASDYSASEVISNLAVNHPELFDNVVNCIKDRFLGLLWILNFIKKNVTKLEFDMIKEYSIWNVFIVPLPIDLIKDILFARNNKKKSEYLRISQKESINMLLNDLENNSNLKGRFPFLTDADIIDLLVPGAKLTKDEIRSILSRYFVLEEEQEEDLGNRKAEPQTQFEALSGARVHPLNQKTPFKEYRIVYIFLVVGAAMAIAAYISKVYFFNEEEQDL